MGLLTGQMAFTKFYVDYDFTREGKKSFVDIVTEYKFAQGNKISSNELTAGFVNIADPLDTELNFEKLFFANFCSFAYREDIKKFPSNTFRIYLAEDMVKYKKQMNKTRLTRQEREALKEDLERRLIAQAIPDIKLFDILWFFERKEMLVFTSSKAILKRLSKLFKLAFNVDLTLIEHLDMIKKSSTQNGFMSKILSLKPFELFGGGTDDEEELEQSEQLEDEEFPEQVD